MTERPEYPSQPAEEPRDAAATPASPAADATDGTPRTDAPAPGTEQAVSGEHPGTAELGGAGQADASEHIGGPERSGPAEQPTASVPPSAGTGSGWAAPSTGGYAGGYTGGYGPDPSGNAPPASGYPGGGYAGPPAAAYPGTGYAGSGYPGADSGYSGAGYPRTGYPGAGQPGYPSYPGYGETGWSTGYGQASGTGAFGPYAPGAPYAGAPETPGGTTPGTAPGTRPDRPRRTVLVAAAVAAVVGAGVGAGTVAVVDNGHGSSAGLAFSTQAAPAAKVDGTITAAADKIRPSVVTISVTSNTESDTGSGVIIRPDGYILTNNHVVTNSGSGATTVVTLADGRRSAGTVVGRDPSDDLAVVKIGLGGLTAATFASSSALQVGQTVVAVGAPLGLSDTVTAGIVSSTARPVQTGDSTTTATFNAVQTDAAINPGNSGGPLVNLTGAVVGINAAIATDQSQGGLQVPGQSSQSGNIGIGFAIPSDEASRIAGQLITNGKATHAVMGVSVRDASQGGSATAPVGARVQAVTAGGPAADAGIKVGDVITQVDTQRIDGADAVVAAIRSYAPYQSVKITYLRGGRSTTVTVRLDSATD